MRYLAILFALLAGCGIPNKAPVSESESKPITAIPESLIKKAWAICTNSWPPRPAYLQAKIAEHPGYYHEVKAWLSSGVATKAYATLMIRNRYHRCIEVSLRYLALADPSKFISDLPFFAESWIDVSIKDRFNGRHDDRLRHARGALHSAAQAARSGGLTSSEMVTVRDYLFDSIQPATWQTRATAWTLDASSAAKAVQIRALSESAMNAYAAIPHLDAAAKLETLRDNQDVRDLFSPAFDAHLDRIIKLADFVTASQWDDL